LELTALMGRSLNRTIGRAICDCLLLVAAILVCLPASGRAVAEGVDPLRIGPRARAWAAETAPPGPARRRLAALTVGLLERGWREDVASTLPAAEAFARRGGDCVSFAFVLVALARSRGVPAVFVAREPEGGERAGGYEVARGHLAVGLDDGDRLLVYDAAGEHRAAAGELRRLTDAQSVGLFRSNRGAALLLAGEWEEAVPVLAEASRVAPDLAAAWLNLGVALRRGGDLAGAEAAYRRALLLEPRSVGAWRNLALLLEERVRSARR
jgi:tetratricopeptide (TPR) repeat protein